MSERGTVALMPTCLVDLVRPEAGVAAVRVLRRAGYRVTFPEGQTCCGQPAWNSGFPEEARRVAATTLEALAGSEGPIVVLSGSCAATMLHAWPELFEGDARAARRARARRRVRRAARAAREPGARDRAPPAGGVPLLLPSAARPARHDVGRGADQLAAGRRARRAGRRRCLLRLRRDVRDQVPRRLDRHGPRQGRPRARGGRRRARLGRRRLPHAPRGRGRRERRSRSRPRRCPSCSSARAGRREHRLRRRQGARGAHRQGARRHRG